MNFLPQHKVASTRLYLALLALTAVVFPSLAHSQNSPMNIASKEFGKTTTGKTVSLYTLTNSQGNSIEMIDYGAIIVSINVPDKDGKRANVNAGFNNIASYEQRHPYFGSTVGRFCNRIAKGSFVLDGKQFKLAINNGPNHLHGGEFGFDRLMWTASKLQATDSVGLRFKLTSPDGQEGYPGTLEISVDYVWDNANKLSISFSATTDKPTHVNLTNHAYFNLAGIGSGTVYGHRLTVASNQFLEVDENMIPTGRLPSVLGTPLDFTSGRAIGEKIQELPATKGYDHCFVVRGSAGSLRMAASVIEPTSGRTMEVFTTQPGVQLYTGNFLDGTAGNGNLKQHEAFCLETQHYPDSPNQSAFPSTLLKPGQTFSQTTTYQFGVLR
jgi:aldose 1-epimerase